ncbi:peptide ABC transporter substrate-binding protein [Abyssisolibacter fermentans]|uniref:peptide ABC transporter substrate-binding protein n=1 Tax=Abyssisolibacter fermentans TaxID=1766203 RepID=UPI00082D8F94|nr:peptide ABC transporter substrate-binding protein [Abyssisolibacter fermentans]
MKKSKLMVLMLCFVMVFSFAFAGCSDGDKPEEPKQPAGDSNQEGDSNQPADNGEELAEEQVLRVNWAAEPPGMDTQITTAALSIEIIRATMEGLVRPDQNGFIKKGSGLAKDWEISDDGLHYKFYLRDAKWSDGTPITTEDIKFSWLRALDPDTAAEYASMLYHIEGAEAYNKGEGSKEDVAIRTPDEKTIEVDLVRPTAQFLELTSFATLIPAQKAAVEKFGEEYAADADKIVYSGPFVISEWNHDQNLNLEKNPNYWDAENVKLERIEGDMIIDANSAVNLYDTDGLDTIVVPSEFVEKYGDTDEYAIIPNATTWYLQYNFTNKIMSNYHIRAAFAQALDSDSFVKNVLNGVGLVAEGLTPPGMPGKDGKAFDELRTSKSLPYDPEAAKKHLEEGLKELGMTKEELQEEVTFLAGDSSGWVLMTQAFQQMWKENLGLEIFVENVSYAIRLDRYNKKDYTISLSGWGGDYNDPMTFMDLFITNGGNNDAYYSSAEYDACIDTAVNGMGDERIDAMLRAEEILVKDLPAHPVYHPVRDMVTRSYVKGIVRPLCGADNDYKWAYLLKH